MKRLRETQQAIQAMLTNEAAVKPEHYIVDDPNLPASQRISIYEDSMRAGLLETLKITYPHCQQLVGPRFFQALAFEYIEHYPSLSPNLNDYGAHFAEFIDTLPSTRQLPYLSDMARLEWAHQQALFGPDPAGLDLEELAAVWQNQGHLLNFQRPSNSSLLYSPYPLHTIWLFNQGELERSTVHLDEGSSRLIVYRLDTSVRIEPLNAIEYDLLNEFDAGFTLEQAYDNAVDSEHAEAIAEALPALMQRGILVGFTLQKD
jgi:hypothetical protein